MSKEEEQIKQIMIFRETKKVIAELDKMKNNFPSTLEESKSGDIEIEELKNLMTPPTVQKFKSGKGRIYSITLDKEIVNSSAVINFDKVYNKIWSQSCDVEKVHMSKILTRQMKNQKRLSEKSNESNKAQKSVT